MHKRPKNPYLLPYAPNELPDDFPINGDRPFEQQDQPITFLHLHDHFELGYCFDGSGVFVVENKVMPFNAGDVVVINPTEMHLASSAAGTVSHWSFLTLDPARLITAPLDEQKYLRVEMLAGGSFRNIMTPLDHPGLGEQVKSIVMELRERRDGYRSAVRAKVWEVMVRLHRGIDLHDLPPRTVSRHTAMDRVAPALAHVAGHYAEPIYMEKLARLCHVSETHFRRLIRAATGVSPQDYITHLRLQMASSLLISTDKRILDIALDTGFATLSSFNRYFKKELGSSPREWRQNRKEGVSRPGSASIHPSAGPETPARPVRSSKCAGQA